MHHLGWVRRVALDREPVATGACEDGGVALVPLGFVELGEPPVQAADLVGLEAGERGIVADELQQLGHQLAVRRDHRGADRRGLLRAGGQHQAGKA